MQLFTSRKLRMLCLALALVLALATGLPALAQAFSVPLQLGDSGEAVRALQERLAQLGFYLDRPNGLFDEATQAALIRFQEINGLLKSGVLDEITHELLYSDEAQGPPVFVSEHALADRAAPSGNYAPSYWSPPNFNTNEYTHFNENRFLSVLSSPLSTFAADVDTASYAKLRAAILRGEAIVPDSVRVEEILNYFHYNYEKPKPGEPFGVSFALSPTPWNAQTQLLLIGLQAAEIAQADRPVQNLVFLIDVSGSMESPDKLPLVKRAFLLLLEQLSPADTVSIVTYASSDQVLLAGHSAADKVSIMEAIENLTAGGSTAGAAGITTAYELARTHFIPGGNNRVLLATDGDLNVGVSDEGSLARLVAKEKEGGIFLSVLGFGDGNYKDNKLKALASHGDGNYAYIDTIHEARRALVQEIGATFLTVAKDVKLQIDFNPARVAGYRLIGYESRLMAAEDFADDQKDGGELGSGHRLSVLYEIVPVGSAFDFGEVTSKYQTPQSPEATDAEWLTLSLRYKEPEGTQSKLLSYPFDGTAQSNVLNNNLRFAAAVAQVAMLLRDSEWKGTASYNSALALLRADTSLPGDPYKEEFLYLVNLLARAE